ncbi:MAG: MFS transporter [Acidimicrobiales bacterium]
MPGSDTTVGSVPIDSALGRLVIATTVLGSAVAMLTATVVNVALPTLARDLDASSSSQQWVINGYLLTISSLILIGGTLGDRYGRVRIYRLGVVWFAAASLACAVAPNVETLIVARLIQGIGGALLTPGSLAIIEATLRKDDRGKGVGRWSGLIGIAGAIGPLVGGILVDWSWRWVFLLNLPIAALVLVMSVRLPESADEEAARTPLDVVGAGLTVATLGGASYALIEGPNGGFGLLDGAAAAVAVCALAVLILVEPGRPGAVVPIDLFTNRVFAGANLITFLVYGGMGVVFFLIPLQLQVTAGFSPLEAGAAFLPSTMLMMLLSSKSGDLAQRIGPRIPLIVGPLLIAVSLLSFTRIGPAASYLTDVLPAVIVLGLGLATSVAPVTAAALGSVPDHRSGAASGVNNALSRTGQLLAIAAIPPIVGLTGDALSDPASLDVGFGRAMIVGAAFVAAGAAASAVLLGDDRAVSGDQRRIHHPSCAIDGAHPHRTVTALNRS